LPGTAQNSTYVVEKAAAGISVAGGHGRECLEIGFGFMEIA
jgi:hypothetical protein